MYLGLGKTSFNSSVAMIDGSSISKNLEVVLSERLTRKKATGQWPSKALENFELNNAKIADNRDIQFVKDFEDELDKKTPFYLYLEKIKLLSCTNKNKNLITLGHHFCHALAAQAFSPFEKCLILVRDGAGNKIKDLKKSTLAVNEQNFLNFNDELNEMVSLYKLENGVISCLEKDYQSFSFVNEFSISNGIGILYEAVATYIFNNKRAAGKVMGLAPFGESLNATIDELLSMFTIEDAFKGKSKDEWEKSIHLPKYKKMAAMIQEIFERESFEYIEKIKKKYPGFENIILTGGTALNCVFNMKLVDKRVFKEIYVPPFPGDECIGVGAAAFNFFKEQKFKKFDIELQHGYFGLKNNIPNSQMIEKLFQEFEVIKSDRITKDVAVIINDGNIVAWYQGRSESGPRALGNRSILAPLGVKGIKDYLNEHIKFREEFRPYGSTFIKEYATDYFEIDENFYSPFMSFALKVRKIKVDELSEVTHLDSTSRAQILTKEQNRIFWDLINDYGNISGIYGLLNTSLNIMSEPIVESLEDLYRFFVNSKIQYCICGNYIIRKKKIA